MNPVAPTKARPSEMEHFQTFLNQNPQTTIDAYQNESDESWRRAGEDMALVLFKEMAARGPNGNRNANIMAKQVGALLHADMGHASVAIGLMDEAQAIVDAGAAPRGAASPVKPVYELYGEILLDLDRPADAIEKFETSLLRLPNRPRSLLGLARAYAGTGDRDGAADAYGRLAEVWAGNQSLEGFQEARRYLETTGQP